MKEEFVNNTIVRLCKVPRTFEYISNNLLGLDPTKILLALENLITNKKITKNDDLYVLKDNTSQALTLDLISPDPQLYLKKYMGYFDFLKTPHPLDFEWRNSTDSLNHLINIIQDFSSVEDKILMLGMPTLFATACLRDLPHNVTLVERNKEILKGLSYQIRKPERFKILDSDIFKVKPNAIGKFYCAMMDPPWYSPFFYQFMWLAANCINVGGLVGISLPPINTRPNLIQERLEWFKFCSDEGLCLESLYPNQLKYAMPFFEFNAFRAAGITDIHPFWRKGDLAFFRKVHKTSNSRPLFEHSSEVWEERSYDSVRFRIKSNSLKNNDSETLSIKHILKGDILPTVSSRDERRKKANIWTSGNRIFETDKPDLFLSCFDSIISNRNNPCNSVEINKVIDFLDLVSELEKKEFNNYLDWLYHEMERQIN